MSPARAETSAAIALRNSGDIAKLPISAQDGSVDERRGESRGYPRANFRQAGRTPLMFTQGLPLWRESGGRIGFDVGGAQLGGVSRR